MFKDILISWASEFHESFSEIALVSKEWHRAVIAAEYGLQRQYASTYKHPRAYALVADHRMPLGYYKCAYELLFCYLDFNSIVAVTSTCKYHHESMFGQVIAIIDSFNDLFDIPVCNTAGINTITTLGESMDATNVSAHVSPLQDDGSQRLVNYREIIVKRLACDDDETAVWFLCNNILETADGYVFRYRKKAFLETLDYFKSTHPESATTLIQKIIDMQPDHYTPPFVQEPIFIMQKWIQEHL